MDVSKLLSDSLVANTDYLPTDEALFANSYSIKPEISLDSLFECPVQSIEQPSFLDDQFNSHQPPEFQPFGRLDLFSATNAFFFDGTARKSCSQESSPVPSLRDDEHWLKQPTCLNSNPPSQKSKSRSPHINADIYESASKHPQRKRGRPRLDRATMPLSVNFKKMQSHRVPHNQVERKYREGLNSELERLRKAIPTLPRANDGNAMGMPRPSKAMVLAGAIDYIKRIERERDIALEKIEQIRSNAMIYYGNRTINYRSFQSDQRIKSRGMNMNGS